MDTNNNKRQPLEDLLKQLDSTSFKAADYMINKNELPKFEPTKDYEQEIEVDYNEVCIKIVNNIASNYIMSDALLSTEKNIDMKNDQAKKLAEVQFLISMVKTNLIRVQEALDSGDISPDLFRINLSYIKEMRESMNERSNHIKTIEKYWSDRSDMLGIETTQEDISLASDSEAQKNKSNKDDNKNKVIMNTRDMNDFMENLMLKEKEKNKANNKK
jgi:hypothetical protein